jgi:rhodanese-related sulfurtransferase
MKLAPLFLSGTMALIAAAQPASAQVASIYQATLGEADQKTAEVSTEQLRRHLADDSVLLLDSRSRAEFVGGHIPGAHNVDGPPAKAVAAVERLTRGEKSIPIVLYCNGPFCQASRRLGDGLVAAGFSNVRRYQLGLPVWRALGGPTAIEIEGVLRVFKADRTAVFFDARSPEEFATGSLPGAHNVPADLIASGSLKQAPMPLDDFNTRIVLFGRDGAQARKLAEALSTRPWHNVTYFTGTADSLISATRNP